MQANVLMATWRCKQQTRSCKLPMSLRKLECQLCKRKPDWGHGSTATHWEHSPGQTSVSQRPGCDAANGDFFKNTVAVHIPACQSRGKCQQADCPKRPEVRHWARRFMQQVFALRGWQRSVQSSTRILRKSKEQRAALFSSWLKTRDLYSLHLRRSCAKAHFEYIEHAGQTGTMES